ncbi:MAG: tRNA (adenosine(37)-N6)-threonylcarbamoyltransferase complex ATPase subunit type 1 TsaE [Bacteroidetes bacterium]|nr:tRNA (adenosine(37)-N6)-threonylcarbamoyltransferase complex ATPase subunit type 1 TsaE [Bacteroidota bacterium]MBS1930983.1 tRNA (adenosine(37)-N6)-threonylcarbamoyltransferase complex ATPase subunit type 1 TsaE [Bacteroidota bacterium]
MEWIFSLNEIQDTALSFWEKIKGKRVVAFHGPVGAGKTTFIHALCDVKKVKGTVGSPTFSLINEYVFDDNGKEQKIYHIDLYRLKNESEAFDAGIEDSLYSNHICFLEWPEKAPSLFPEDTLHVFIEAVNAERRRLIIKYK